jgi:hypothetical protein
MHIIFLLAIGAVGGILYSTFFEWFLHKHIMHKRVKWWKKLQYAFEAHVERHHSIYGSDETYHADDENHEHVENIAMAWWAGPVIVLVTELPICLISLATGQWWFQLGCIASCSVYFFAYEYMHYCMHLPREPKLRLIERSWIFRKLNGHHLLHHQHMSKHNFNVVLPLADWILGTLLLRSKRPFPQAQGETVPNVQPP